jgi:hypothetical protein
MLCRVLRCTHPCYKRAMRPCVDCFDDGRRQLTAAACLLQHSHLVKWHRTKAEFAPVDLETFEKSWLNIDRSFGRFICWVTFSAGAELLAKGVCLVHEVDMRKPEEKPRPPSSGDDLREWARQFNVNPTFGGTVTTRNYRTLGKLYTRGTGYLEGLFRKMVNVEQCDRELLLAAYQLLAGTIRNRDAHAYIKDVRDDHFHLVSELFVPCFNLMVSWLPEGSGTLSEWIDHPQ